MDSDMVVMAAVAATWIALLGLIAWSVHSSWRRVLDNQGPLPLFAMLERRGLDLERLQGSSESLYGAVRRCAMCREQASCAEWLAGRRSGPAPACPNADYMDGAARA